VKKIAVANSKKVKKGWSNFREIYQNLLRKDMAEEGLLCQ
jgi:hypothetical protein